MKFLELTLLIIVGLLWSLPTVVELYFYSKKIKRVKKIKKLKNKKNEKK